MNGFGATIAAVIMAHLLYMYHQSGIFGLRILFIVRALVLSIEYGCRNWMIGA
jgi:hypothetical protein